METGGGALIKEQVAGGIPLEGVGLGSFLGTMT